MSRRPLATALAGAARRHLPRLALAAPLLLAAADALARGGGGHSYSGGSLSGEGDLGSHTIGSGGGGDGGLVLLVLEILFRHPAIGIPLLVVVGVVFVSMQRAGRLGQGFSTGAGDALAQTASTQAWQRGRAAPTGLEQLRQDDPDFSEPLFLDFVSALAARAVAAAGTSRAASLESYVAGPRALLAFGEGGWQNVVVGSVQLRSVLVAPGGTRIQAEVALGASSAAGGRWWRCTWTFGRRAGVRSKGPGEITRLACPACGAGSERREDGACRYCGQRPAPGEAAWALEAVQVLEAEARPPIALGGYAEEVGTTLPTLRSPTLEADLAALPRAVPGFTWPAARDRFGQVFLKLQQAWSDRELAALRPLTTDAVFSTWRYWVEAYRAAGLRNRLEHVRVVGIEPARVALDRYYAAVTVRIFASMMDQTVDDGGRVVDGAAAARDFTEYWTFVRTLAAAKADGVTCAGCGASLPAGQSGQCPYCGSLVGAPAFDWILSRIDQDEDYTGT
jgi:predicted lipid-binding transport protein (Tim44 family)